MNDKKALPWRGHQLNAKTILMLQSAERRLDDRLELFQGSFSQSVGDSKKTHSQGGAFDAKRNDQRVVRVLREVGFAAWARHEPPFDVEHTHAVSLFDKNLHQQATDQVVDYKNGGDGLGTHTGNDDPDPRVALPDRPILERQVVRRRDILFNQNNKSVGYLQDVLGAVPDEFFGEQTRTFTRAKLGWDGSRPLGLIKFMRCFPRSVFKRKIQLLPFM